MSDSFCSSEPQIYIDKLSLSTCKRSWPYRNPWVEWVAVFATRIETKRFPAERKVFTQTAQRGFDTGSGCVGTQQNPLLGRRRRQTQPTLGWSKTRALVEWVAVFATRIETKRFPAERKVFTKTAQRGFDTWRRRRRQTQPTSGWSTRSAPVERRCELDHIIA